MERESKENKETSTERYHMKVSKYRTNELKYLKKVLNHDNFSDDMTWCNALEDKFAKMFGAKYGIVMNSGTATLHSALEAVGVGHGDEVICPAITVIMDTTTVWQCNAIPVYADVDPNTFTIDPKDIEKKITPKTKAIIVVSLYGLPCDMDSINKISKKYGIPVIEDHAQCCLSKYNGEIVGVSNSFSSWSFESTKHLSCGEGGILLTNDESYAQAARKVGGHWYKNLTADGGRIKFNDTTNVKCPSYKRHDAFGINYRLSEFSASIALAQLEDLENKVEKRKQVANMFLDVIKGCDFLTPQYVPENCESSYYTLGVLYNEENNPGCSWQQFRDKFVEFGGDSFYSAWSIPYLEPVVTNREYVQRCPEVYESVSYTKGLCPVAEMIQPKLMQFKTNYRDMNIAMEKAECLSKTINYFARTK